MPLAPLGNAPVQPPLIREEAPNPLGAKIIGMILKDKPDVQWLNKSLDSLKASPFDGDKGVIGYTRATLKTIWAGFIYILKAPIIFIGNLFGREFFLDKTLIETYTKLVNQGNLVDLANFLLGIRDLTKVSDQVLLEQLIENSPANIPLNELLDPLSLFMAFNYLEEHIAEGTYSEASFNRYLASLNTTMENHHEIIGSDLILPSNLKEIASKKAKAIANKFNWRCVEQHLYQIPQKKNLFRCYSKLKRLQDKQINFDETEENKHIEQVKACLNGFQDAKKEIQSYIELTRLIDNTESLEFRRLDLLYTIYCLLEKTLKIASIAFDENPASFPSEEEQAEILTIIHNLKSESQPTFEDLIKGRKNDELSEKAYQLHTNLEYYLYRSRSLLY